jgi:hypothetical protein
MLSTCNAACAGALSLTLTTQCDIYQRSEVPIRLIGARCDTAMPVGDYDDTLHATAVASLFDSFLMTATFELAEFAWSDPTTTTKNYFSRKRPARTKTTGRSLTARDFAATDTDAAGTASPYEDRLFYKNIIQNPAFKFRGYVTEQGRIYLFLNEQGEFMDYDINFWTGWDNDVDGQSVEFKNYALNFIGDPLKYATTPYLDIIASGAQSDLGWLYQPI